MFSDVTADRGTVRRLGVDFFKNMVDQHSQTLTVCYASQLIWESKYSLEYSELTV